MWRPSSISKVFRSWSFQIIRARGVDRAGRYEPDLNRMYLDMATPYAIAVMPARPRKPRDKAKVENALPSGNCRAVAAGRLGCVRLSSLCPFRLLHTFPSSRPTRNYPRLWIRRSSFERRRDLNPPESRAAQRTIGLVHPPRSADGSSIAPPTLLEFRQVALDPPEKKV